MNNREKRNIQLEMPNSDIDKYQIYQYFICCFSFQFIFSVYSMVEQECRTPYDLTALTHICAIENAIFFCDMIELFKKNCATEN